MSTRTANPPPLAIAALLSPVLWRLNRPDKFDTYAIGLMLMQMAFPNMRTDNQLIAFRRTLESMEYDLKAWRRKQEGKGLSKDLQAGFDILDMDNGAGWNLVCELMEKKPQKRVSARSSLNRPYFSGGATLIRQLDTAIIGEPGELGTWVLNNMSKNGLESAGGFTEGQLEEMGYKGKVEDPNLGLPSIFVNRLKRTVARVGTRSNRLNPKALRSGLNFWRQDTTIGS